MSKGQVVQKWATSQKQIAVLKSSAHPTLFVNELRSITQPTPEVFNLLLNRLRDYDDGQMAYETLAKMRQLNYKTSNVSFLLSLEAQQPDAYAERIGILNMARRQFAANPVFNLAEIHDLPSLEVVDESEEVDGVPRDLTDCDLGGLHAYCLMHITDMDGMIGAGKVNEAMGVALSLVREFARNNRTAHRFITAFDAREKVKREKEESESELSNEHESPNSVEADADEEFFEFSTRVLGLQSTKISVLDANVEDSREREVPDALDRLIPLPTSMDFRLGFEDQIRLEIALLKLCDYYNWREFRLAYRRVLDEKLFSPLIGPLARCRAQIYSALMSSYLFNGKSKVARSVACRAVVDLGRPALMERREPCLATALRPYLLALQESGAFKEMQDFFIEQMAAFPLTSYFTNAIFDCFLNTDPPPSLSGSLDFLQTLPLSFRSSIQPHNMILKFLGRREMSHAAVEYLDSVAKQGIVPNASSYNYTLRALLDSGQFSELLKLFEYVKSIGLADVTSYKILLASIGDQYESIENVALANQWCPTSSIHSLVSEIEEFCDIGYGQQSLRNNMLICMHRVHMYSDVVEYYEKLTSEGFVFRAGSHARVMDACFHVDRLDLVETIFKIASSPCALVYFDAEMMQTVCYLRMRAMEDSNERWKFFEEICLRRYGKFSPNLVIYNSILLGMMSDVSTHNQANLLSRLTMIIRLLIKDPFVIPDAKTLELVTSLRDTLQKEKLDDIVLELSKSRLAKLYKSKGMSVPERANIQKSRLSLKNRERNGQAIAECAQVCLIADRLQQEVDVEANGTAEKKRFTNDFRTKATESIRIEREQAARARE